MSRSSGSFTAVPLIVALLYCPSPAQCDVASVATAFLQEHAVELGLPENLSGIEVDTVVVGRGASHVHFTHVFEGIPVYGSRINVAVSNATSAVTFISSSYLPDIDVASTTPSYSFSSVQIMADSTIGTSHEGVIVDSVLVIYRDTSQGDHLAWFFAAYGDSVEPTMIIVDAQTNDLLHTFPIAQFTPGRGAVFTPDPVTRSGNPGLDDSSNPPTQEVDLPHLFGKDADDLYRIKGDASFRVESKDLWTFPPEGDPVVWTPVARADSAFIYTRADSAFEEVNAYYHIYKMNDYLKETLEVKGLVRKLVFDVHNYPTSAYAGVWFYDFAARTHEIRFDDNGSTGVDGGEDPDFIVHELTHAFEHEYLPPRGCQVCSPLRDWESYWLDGTLDMSRLAEGYADYVAISYRRATEEEENLCGNGLTFPDYIGSWYSQPEDYRRKLEASYHYPQQCPPYPVYGDPHFPGGVLWASTLMDIEEAIGRTRAMTTAMESMMYLGKESSMVGAAHALVQAYEDNFPNELEDVGEIVRVLASRGFLPTVRGSIAENATWNGSQYVSGDVEVAAGVTLTIAPAAIPGRNFGTVICFAADSDSGNLGFDVSRTELIVDGGLEVQGTAGRPMYFVSGGKASEEPPAQSCSFVQHLGEEGDWWGIYFGGGGGGTIDYADVRDSQWGVVVGTSSATVISNCSFSMNELTDIKAGTSSSGLEIRGNTIDVGGGTGIDLGLASVVQDNTIRGSGDSDIGILFQPPEALTDSVLFYGNTVQDVEAGNAFELGGDSIGVLVSNQILDCHQGVRVTRGKHLIGTEDDGSDNTIVRTTTAIKVEKLGPEVGCPSSQYIEARVSNCYLDLYTNGVYTVKAADQGDLGFAELGTDAYGGSGLNFGNNAFYGGEAYNPSRKAIWNSAPDSCGTVLARGNYFGPYAGAVVGLVDTTGQRLTEPLGFRDRMKVEPVPPRPRLVLLGLTPNPVSTSTSVIFEVSGKPVEATAMVFNVAGRLVRHLGGGAYEPGRQVLVWDGKDSQGRPAPNGLYFVRLAGSGFSPVQSRIVVLRQQGGAR